FRYLLLEDPRPRVAWIVDDIVDLLSGAPVRAILDRYFHENLGGDPMIQFYETFLVEYDHDLRASRGVYYTPPQVVSYIVRSVHEVLRARLGRDDGLADPGVTILDPAAGTLTFLVEVFREAIRAYREAHGEAGVPALLRDHERFQLYLTNALDLGNLSQMSFPGMGALSREARAAARVKRDQPITVVLGNPP